MSNNLRTVILAEKKIENSFQEFGKAHPALGFIIMLVGLPLVMVALLTFLTLVCVTFINFIAMLF